MSRSRGFGPVLRLVGLVLGLVLLGEHLVAYLPAGWQAPAAMAAAFLAVAVAVVRRRELSRRLGTVHASVVLLVIFGLSCTTGSFLLQVADLEARNLHGAEARQAFRMAEAEFLHRLFGSGNLNVPLPEDIEAQLARDEAELGAEEAARRRKAWIFRHREEFRTRKVEAFAEAHAGVLDALEGFARATRLDDVYRSAWFFTLMVLLGMSLLSAVRPRLSLRLDRGPFLATHLGFLLLMLGFGVSRFWSMRGRLPLQVGQTLTAVTPGSIGEVNADLGFPVKLGAFYAEARTKLAIQIDGEDGRAARNQVDARPGQSYEYSGGQYRIEVLDAAPYGVAAPKVVPAAPDDHAPAALEVAVVDAGETTQGWLFATGDRRAWLTGDGRDYAVTFHWDDPAAWMPAPRDAWGVLELGTAMGPAQLLPVLVGASATVGDKTVRVAEVCSDFARRGLPLAEQPRTNPAVRLEIEGPDGATASRWSFAWVDFDTMHQPAFPELKLKYHFSSGDLGPERQFRIVGGEAGMRLVRFDAEGDPLAESLDDAVQLDLGSRQLSLAIHQVHAAARQELQVLPLTERELRAQESADGGHGHSHEEGLFSHLSPTTHRLFHPPGPPAVRLRIFHPGGEVERWFLADTSGAAGWSDGRFHLAFGTTPNDVAEWRSLLVVGEGEATERHVVRVNHPLSYRGWTFYQHDANPERPNYSGILAVYDPGWPLVALALLLVSFGVAGMFWVQPFLKRRPGVERGAR